MRTIIQTVSVAILFLTACSKKDSTNPADVLPKITTTLETAVTSTSATTGGNITADGGSQVIARGVCWIDTNSDPTVADSATKDGAGTGTFNSKIVGLIPYDAYYVRAYATNASGTAYRNTLIALTLPGLLVETGGVESFNHVLSC